MLKQEKLDKNRKKELTEIPTYGHYIISTLQDLGTLYLKGKK